MADQALSLPPKVNLLLGGTKGKLVRFSYLHVFTPQLNTQSGEMKFSVLVMIPKTNTEDIAAVKKAVEDFKRQTWLSQGRKVPPNFWNPLRDGDVDTKQDGSDYPPECKGHYLLNCSADEDHPPDVAGIVKGPDGKLQRLGKRDIKSGDWGRIKLQLYVYVKGNTGVGAGVLSLQKVKDGEPLATSANADADFAGFDDEDDDPSALLA